MNTRYTGKIIELFWDCNSKCGRKGNPGSAMNCLGCGVGRPKDTFFYQTTKSRVVTDTGELERAKSGEDKVCTHCQRLNKNRTISCTQCGSTDFKSISSSKIDNNQIISTQSVYKAHNVENNNNILLFSFFMLLLIMVVSGFYYLKPVNYSASLVDHTWNRYYDISTPKTLIKEGESYPQDATIISERKEIVDHESVLDYVDTVEYQSCSDVKVGEKKYACGYENMNNGYSREKQCTKDIKKTVCETKTKKVNIYRSVPVYGTIYEYSIIRYSVDKTIHSFGHKLPFSPVAPLIYGNQRLSHTDKFSLNYKYDDDIMGGYTTRQYDEYNTLVNTSNITISVQFGRIKSVIINENL